MFYSYITYRRFVRNCGTSLDVSETLALVRGQIFSLEGHTWPSGLYLSTSSLKYRHSQAVRCLDQPTQSTLDIKPQH